MAGRHSYLALIMGVTALLAVSVQAAESAKIEPRTFEPGRRKLEVPDEIWQRVLKGLDLKEGSLGYSTDQMARFKTGTTHVLPTVERLFRDVRDVPRFSGAVGDFLLKNAQDPSKSAWLAYRYLGAYAGRGVTAPKPGTWAADWVAEGATPRQAVEAAMRRGTDGKEAGFSPAQEKAWAALAPRDRRLAAAIVVAAVEARRILEQAFDAEFLTAALGDDRSPAKLYALATAPWKDSLPGRISFEALNRIDLKYLAFGSIAFLRYVTAALEEWEEAVPGERGEFFGFFANTRGGAIRILGTGSDHLKLGGDLIIDLGGDDVWEGRFGSTGYLDRPVSLLIDLDGNDKYDAVEIPGGLACGLFGLGAVIDCAGNDSYVCPESGLGCAWYGTGLLLDFDGNDQYRLAGNWGQGAAHAGVGMLIDLAGTDRFFCGGQAQGFGGTLGVGILVDSSGDDVYEADLTKNISKAFGDRPVSFAQGTAYGRRADFGDGHCLGGGIGILVDGAGNDTYTAGVYGQGSGYWWAFGILEDRGGDDRYSNMWYSLGSAPHFAVGCCVDLSGNDRYNVGNTKLRCQTQGCARDASVAWFIDGCGDDVYYHTNRCGGSGDLNSIALFWDRAGNDTYTSDRNAPYERDRSWGGACLYPPFNGFRDRMLSAGVFLDTGGKDRYEEKPHPTSDKAAPTEAGNDKAWQHENTPRFRSFGLDLPWYASRSGEKKNGK